MRKQSGFTLIEILVVVALIAILAAITIVALNPAKAFADARNTERKAEIAEIANGIGTYLTIPGKKVSDIGGIPACSGTPSAILISGTAGSGEVSLEPVVTADSLSQVPADPNAPSATDSGYEICATTTAGGSVRLTISAPLAENSETISLTR